MPITAHAACRLVDMYIAATCKSPTTLLGSTALMIAIKENETSIPELADYAWVCKGAYRADQILDIEKSMLGKLHGR